MVVDEEVEAMSLLSSDNCSENMSTSACELLTPSRTLVLWDKSHKAMGIMAKDVHPMANTCASAMVYVDHVCVPLVNQIFHTISSIRGIIILFIHVWYIKVDQNGFLV